MGDVPIKVGDLYVPVDFVILDMEGDIHNHIILGRPFLATTRCRIDVKNGKLCFNVGDDHLEFNLFKASTFPSLSDECHMIDMIYSLVWETVSNLDFNGHLEHCMLHYSAINDKNSEVAMCAQFLEASPQIPPIVAKVETLVNHEKPSFDEERAPEVELKSLSSSLRYEFLRPNFTYPVIINTSLSASQIDSLLRVLTIHLKAIRYTLANLKGILPSVCMHRSLMEDYHKPLVEHQRMLNPNMQEVVKKEILKLLKVDIIYPISNSK